MHKNQKKLLKKGQKTPIWSTIWVIEALKALNNKGKGAFYAMKYKKSSLHLQRAFLVKIKNVLLENITAEGPYEEYEIMQWNY